jgi:protein tyrosine phosphatase
MNFQKCYWVIPGKFMAGAIPLAGLSADVNPCLEDLHMAGINHIINLMEADEKNEQGDLCADYTSEAAEQNIKLHRFPIHDLCTPDIYSMYEILKLIKKLLQRRDNVIYLHCRGGVGRTGTVLGCFLKQVGYSNNHTVFGHIDYLKRSTVFAHKLSPETEVQREFVLEWS